MYIDESLYVCLCMIQDQKLEEVIEDTKFEQRRRNKGIKEKSKRFAKDDYEVDPHPRTTKKPGGRKVKTLSEMKMVEFEKHKGEEEDLHKNEWETKVRFLRQKG
ncbi:hypothetical protein GQ457_11G020970 [Hibiscus cannabinus]